MEVVTELLSGLGRRTVLRMKNKEGRTPLHMAAKAHQTGVVTALMQAGACAAIKDKVSTCVCRAHSVCSFVLVHVVGGRGGGMQAWPSRTT